MIYLLLMALLSSCTISMQNIDTHGTANDLVDDNQTPNVAPIMTFPLGAIG
jgi:hypothetical protein